MSAGATTFTHLMIALAGAALTGSGQFFREQDFKRCASTKVKGKTPETVTKECQKKYKPDGNMYTIAMYAGFALIIVGFLVYYFLGDNYSSSY